MSNTPINDTLDEIESRVLTLREQANKGSDDVAVAYRQALRDVLREVGDLR